MGLRIAPRLAFERIAPPLEAHFAGQRIGNDLAHPGDLQVEGIERRKVQALVGGSEQVGEPAVAVARADQFVAVKVMGGQCRNRQRTPSGDGQQRGGDTSPLAEQDIVSADRRTRRHRIDRNAGRREPIAQGRRRKDEASRPVPRIRSSMLPAGSAKTGARAAASISCGATAAQA